MSSYLPSSLHPSNWLPGDELRYDGNNTISLDKNQIVIIIQTKDIYNDKFTIDVEIKGRFGYEYYRANEFTFIRGRKEIRNSKINQILK